MSNFNPAYKKVQEYIRLQIKSGVLQPNDLLPSQAELMKLFDISRGTVHIAISKLIEEGIIYGIHGLGNFVSTHEFSNELILPQDTNLKAIGFIIPYDFRFTPELLMGIENQLSTIKYRVILCNSNGKPQREAELIDQLLDEGIQHLIIYTSHSEKHHAPLIKLQKINFPFVLISTYIASFPCDFVVSNNVEGGYQAGFHLCELGHRSIAVFLWSDFVERATVKERLIGFKRALSEFKISFSDDQILGCTYEKFANRDKHDESKGFYSAFELPLRKALAENPSLSAIFCVNDVIAIELIRCLNHLKLRVPEDISVIGFDDNAIDLNLQVPLTSIRQEFYELGQAAVNIIISKLEKPTNIKSSYYLPTKLIVRQSTAPYMQKDALLTRG